MHTLRFYGSVRRELGLLALVSLIGVLLLGLGPGGHLGGADHLNDGVIRACVNDSTGSAGDWEGQPGLCADHTG